ncbi:MAG: phosphoribosylamine--glycine ligase [Deltaproteobacteria bacterium]|nr:phosphoribosylamine--glycine ligase [Deltaproteobacteria bacterium]
MRCLIVGNGGREHALLYAVKKSRPDVELFATRPNAGMSGMCNAVNVSPEDPRGIVDFSKKNGIDLVVAGPEVPLSLGLANMAGEAGVNVLGPVKEGARLEASKSFAKRLMKKQEVPTADYEIFHEPEKAADYLKQCRYPVVIKADGLAAGKGVFIVYSQAEACGVIEEVMVKKVFGPAGISVVIEEFLKGREVSYICLIDGENVLPLASSKDHKRIYDGDTGPNTGGMGAFSPAELSPGQEEFVVEKVIKPVLAGLRERGIVYRGFLYAGLMLTKDGIKVLEFNCRSGDPETQPIVMRAESDLFDAFYRAASGTLAGVKLSWSPDAALTVVAVSKGYPGIYEKGREINGLDEIVESDDVRIFHAGTSFKDNRAVTSGGRVLNVTARGATIQEAREKVYSVIERISFDGIYYRSDIGL